MTDYLYRALYKIKDEYWPAHLDPTKNVWEVVNNRSYNSLTSAKIVRSQHEYYTKSDGRWVDGKYITEPTCLYKFQQYPLTQEWKDINV